MSRRRESRRRHRDDRRQRSRAGAPDAPVAVEAPPAPRRNISWMGLLGGLAGAVPLAALAVAVLIDPGEGTRWWSLIFAALSLGFLPAVWASVVETPRRQAIQKAVVVGCLAVAFTGTVLFGVGVAILLALPTTLLAIAAGLVFQGGARTKR